MGNKLVQQKHHIRHFHEKPALVSAQQPTYKSTKILDSFTIQQPADEQNKILASIEVSIRLLNAWEQRHGKWDHDSSIGHKIKLQVVGST
jgi:hypothetical protein